MQKTTLGSTKGSPPPATLNPFFGLTRRLAALWPKHATGVVLAVAAAGVFAVSAAHANTPTSTLYLLDWNPTPVAYNEYTDTLITVQGGTGAMSLAPMQSEDAAIAVTNSIKTLSWNAFGVVDAGSQYTLNGTYTGTTYPVPSAVQGASFFDGASDGTNNYAVDHGTGNVWKFNGNWANPQLLFTASDSSSLGIAYDTTNNTLWISNDSFDSSSIYHYSLTGTLLGSFQLADSGNTFYTGLALDPADNTLWIFDYADGADAMDQYSKDGTFLGQLSLAGADPGAIIFGAEFAEATPTPIPGALLLFGPGLAALAFVRRRFGK